MSYDTGRAAIEAYFISQWTATPFGLDGHPFEPSAGSVRLSITEGQTLQGSIGRTSNVINHVGVLTVQIYAQGGVGSSAWRGHAETLMGLFFAKALDADGVEVTDPAQTTLVRFSPPELGDNRHPYIGTVLQEAPYVVVSVLCPFIRYETR